MHGKEAAKVTLNTEWSEHTRMDQPQVWSSNLKRKCYTAHKVFRLAQKRFDAVCGKGDTILIRTK